MTVDQALPDARVQLGGSDILDTQGELGSTAAPELQDHAGAQAPKVNVQLYVGFSSKKEVFGNMK